MVVLLSDDCSFISCMLLRSLMIPSVNRNPAASSASLPGVHGNGDSLPHWTVFGLENKLHLRGSSLSLYRAVSTPFGFNSGDADGFGGLLAHSQMYNLLAWALWWLRNTPQPSWEGVEHYFSMCMACSKASGVSALKGIVYCWGGSAWHLCQEEVTEWMFVIMEPFGQGFGMWMRVPGEQGLVCVCGFVVKCSGFAGRNEIHKPFQFRKIKKRIIASYV